MGNAPEPTGARPAAQLVGTRFDGVCAQAQPVIVEVDGEALRLRSSADGTLICTASLGTVEVAPPFRSAPRRLQFADGATVEVTDNTLFDAAMARVDRRPSIISRLENAWPVALASLALLLATLAFAYVRGVPVVASWLALSLPADFEQNLGTAVLKTLDDQHLRPSALSRDRRDAIAARFAAAAERAAPGVAYRIEFRDLNGMSGVNAFALPGGTIVLLDGLSGTDSRMALSDDQVLAVLAHELGHVVHKHVMRRLMQTAGVSVLASVLWGDAAGLAANVPTVLGFLLYTREFEREADDFAIAFLQANGLPASPLVEFFRQIEGLDPGRMPGFLRTHPTPRERRERLQSETAAGTR